MIYTYRVIQQCNEYIFSSLFNNKLFNLHVKLLHNLHIRDRFSQSRNYMPRYQYLYQTDLVEQFCNHLVLPRYNFQNIRPSSSAKNTVQEVKFLHQ